MAISTTWSTPAGMRLNITNREEIIHALNAACRPRVGSREATLLNYRHGLLGGKHTESDSRYGGARGRVIGLASLPSSPQPLPLQRQ